MREGVKALLLMNGGGSVALLAILQAIWMSDALLAKPVLSGLVWFLVGVVFAGIVHPFRVHTSNETQHYFTLLSVGRLPDDPQVLATVDRAAWWTRLYLAAALACFVVGVFQVLRGANCVLSYGCMPS